MARFNRTHLALLLLATVAVLSMLLSSPCWAQGGSKQLTVDGTVGMWFPMDVAKRMLADLERCKGQSTELDLTKQRLSLEQVRSDLLTKNLTTTEQVASTWKGLAEDQAKRLSSKDPWWKSPYLWSAVGFVIGTGVTVGATAAIGAVTK